MNGWMAKDTNQDSEEGLADHRKECFRFASHPGELLDGAGQFGKGRINPYKPSCLRIRASNEFSH